MATRPPRRGITASRGAGKRCSRGARTWRPSTRSACSST
jgi:hypothetical protein